MTRYYSARRLRTKWSRAGDVALVIAVLLSPVAVAFMNSAVVTKRERDHVFGRLMIGSSGKLFAQLIPKELKSSPWLSGTTPMSEFEIVVFSEVRGWPVTTASVVQSPAVEITEIAEQQTRKGVVYRADYSAARAIVAGLESAGQGALASSWMTLKIESNVLVLGWIFGCAMWTVMLWVVMLLIIGVTRLLLFTLLAKSQLRGAHFKADGKCAHCGYDLRGLEFQDRCPECGKLAW